MEQHVREQITREDLLTAIAALDRGEVHDFRPSNGYDLWFEGKVYPVGLGARRALGRALRQDEFSGGGSGWAFRGHPIRVVTLDLAREWTGIRDQLLGFLKPIRITSTAATSHG